MVPLSESFATAQISDHELRFFYTIDGLDPRIGPTSPTEKPLVMADLVIGDKGGMPTDQKTATASERYGSQAVWQKAKGPPASRDFQPHIRDIIEGNRHDLMVSYELSEPAKRLLGRADLYAEGTAAAARVAKGKRLLLSKAAATRLTALGVAIRPLRLTDFDVRLHLFSTRHGLIEVVVRLDPSSGGPLSPLELLEAQIALGRFNTIEWYALHNEHTYKNERFAFGDLVFNLVAGSQKKRLPYERVWTYTFVQFGALAAGTDIELYATHLARHYTTDYAISGDLEGLDRVDDFETVRHAIALEGAATVVAPTAGMPALPAFLKDFRTAAFQRHYAPIALLAQHERTFLVARTSIAVIGGDPQSEQNLEIMDTLVRDSVLFRLRFRFSSVSYISMHNAVNRAFRTALDLDRILSELAPDIQEAEIQMRQARDRKRAEEQRQRDDAQRVRDKRFFWSDRTGNLALGGLTAFTVVKEMIGVLDHRGKTAEWGGFVAFLVVVIGMIAYTWWRRPSSDHGEFGHHAATDNMMERARSHRAPSASDGHAER